MPLVGIFYSNFYISNSLIVQNKNIHLQLKQKLQIFNNKVNWLVLEEKMKVWWQ